jgi:DNA topoisomerase I
MAYELLIAEKPSAAQKIAVALADGKPEKRTYNKKVPYYELTHDGKKMVVCAAVGHLYNLSESKKQGWTYPVYDIEWKASYNINKNADYTKDYVLNMEKLSKKANNFTICTDFDVEGELIGLNALRFACHQKDANRMKFSTLTKGDLLEAYEKKTKHIDWGQAHAGETRHKLDWFYGINLSRALTASIKAAKSFKVMSIGRVQGPALKLVVDRELEIQKFVPVPFWQIHLDGQAKNKTLEAWHVEDKFWDERKAKNVFSTVKGAKKAAVLSVKRTQFNQQAPHPFDLTTLQTESYAHHGMSPKETLGHAQKLYISGVISYPRTSSQQLTPKLGFEKILTALKSQKEYAPLCDGLLKLKDLKPNNGKKTDAAHPAIYPTGNFPKAITARERKVYDLIVKRFMATFGEPATRETMTVMLDVKKEEFKAVGKRTVSPGWHIYYRPYVKHKDIELPGVEKGDDVLVKKIELLKKETSPPKRFTQSSIIRELEKHNLGTKATRADIVDRLFQRGYAEGKQIAATELGIHTVKTLKKYSPKILDEELTRGFEEDMEEIREGKEKPQKVLDAAKKVLNGILKDFKQHEEKIGQELLKAVRDAQEKASVLGKCHNCSKGMLRIIMSKKSKKRFVACDAYPKCETTYGLPQNALIKPVEGACDVCNFPKVLVIRKRARPQTLCVNEKCTTRALDKEEKAEVKKIEAGKIKKKCPECKNPLVLRKSFYGQFWGCSSYPKCRHTEKLDADKKKAKAWVKKKAGKTKKKALRKKVARKKK